mmetsp:Transcript_3745/g.11084  ORF Transcript_3745/g.11084 Transcript_3745/m.11084 type:complete len:200 (+) Transcript_3745:25-624(+)
MSVSLGTPNSRTRSPGGFDRTLGSRGSSRGSTTSLSLQIAALADTRRGLELHASAEALDAAPRDPRFHDPASEARWDNTSPLWGRYIPEFGVKKNYNCMGQSEEHVRRPTSIGILPPAGGARGGPRVTPLLSYNSIGWNRRHYEPMPNGATSSRQASRMPFAEQAAPPRIDWVDSSARPPIVLHSNKKIVVPARIGVWY